MTELIILIYIIIGFMYGILYLFDKDKPYANSIQEIGLTFIVIIFGWLALIFYVVYSNIYRFLKWCNNGM